MFYFFPKYPFSYLEETNIDPIKEKVSIVEILR